MTATALAGGAVPASWPREALGALNAAAALLPLMLGWAFIAFGVLGAPGMQVGLVAGALAVVLGALVYVAASRAPMPAGAPSSSAALLLGACVAKLVRDPALQAGAPGGLALLLAATGAVVAASGLLMVGLGALRAGVLVRYVPQPVLAGFLNGVAVLMVIGQLPALFPAGHASSAVALALAAAAATATVMGVVQWRWVRLPSALLALVLGTLLAQALQAGCGAALAAPGACRQELIGPLVLGGPRADLWAPWLDGRAWAVLAPHLGTLAAAALLLAVIGSLESALNVAQVDETLGRRTEINREFIALGLANLASGLAGGLPLVFLRLRAAATLAAGPCTWRAVVLSSALVALALAAAPPLLAHVPLAVVAGMVCMLAWALVDRWTRRLVVDAWRGERTPEALWSLATVAVVCVFTALAGLLAGVAAGVLLSMLIFMRAMNRSLVRLRYSAAEIASRRVYPPALEAALAPLRPRVVVVELEGAVFFGNVDRLEQEAAKAAAQSACSTSSAVLTAAASPASSSTAPAPAAPASAWPLPRFVVLDLRRVSTLDASGAVRLTRLRDRFALEGCRLVLAGVTADNRHGRVFKAQAMLGGAGPVAWQLHPDADHAIEAAELALLRAQGTAIEELTVPAAGNALLQGLPAAAAAALEACLPRRRLDAGEQLFAQGDAGRSIYLLVEGSVSVLDRATGQRFISFSPGMCFGETAVLDGRGRTADARADVASTVLELPAALLAELEHQTPAVAATIFRNLALHLSERLRGAAAAWRHAAG